MPEVSETARQTSFLQKGLEQLLDVGFEARSVPQDEMARWCANSSLINVNRPHENEIIYVGQPVSGMTKEFEFQTLSGEKYRIVMHPNWSRGVVSNDVKVKFSKTYEVGENKDIGDLTKSDDKNVLYLLPLVAKLPVKNITYESVREFFEKNNGFVYDMKRSETSQFRDEYKQNRAQPKDHLAETPWLDVYVTIQDIKGKSVKVDLEVAIPKKVIA